jgi:hypothetical protein
MVSIMFPDFKIRLKIFAGIILSTSFFACRTVRPMQIKFLLIFLLLTSFAFGQSLDVDNIYNFSPSKLTK